MMNIKGKKDVNEEYYYKDNNPNFFQFGKNYHFFDDKDRVYIIATKNKDIFNNPKFKVHNLKNKMKDKEIKHCLVNNYGYVTLFVKLLNPNAKWFSNREIGKFITLINHKTKESIQVKLKFIAKSNIKRRTGTIQVSGVDTSFWDEILNK